MDPTEDLAPATALRRAVDELLAVDLTGCTSAELVAVLTSLETQRRRLDAVDAQLLAEIGDRGVAGEYGRTSTADLLVNRLHIAASEATQRLARARDLAPRHDLSGAPLDPILPATSHALTTGEISTGHVTVIAGCLNDLPPTLAVEATGVAEHFLVEAARHLDPRALRHTAALLLTRLDPDGTQPREDLIERRRSYTLVDPGDGSLRPTGRLTAQTAAVWQTILDALSAPATTTDAHGTQIRDDRSPSQHRHDALLEAGLRLLRSGTLPETGGTPVTVLIHATPTDLASDSGLVRTHHGTVLSTRRLLRLAGDTALTGLELSIDGAVLNHGRERRLANTTQRRALAARDGGCSFPGCARPSAWCQTAHITAWAHGGPTDIDNLTLLCSHHHRLYDQGKDWTIIMINRIPHWIPPPWIDPEQHPTRNTTRHLDVFDVMRDAVLG